MKFIHVIILLFAFFELNVNCQSKSDSLWSIWEDESEEDTIRLESIRSYIGREALFSDQEKAIELAEEQYEFANKVNNLKYRADARNTQGIAYSIQSKFNFAVDKYLSALSLYEKDKNLPGQASVMNNIGIMYSDMEDFEMALKYYEKSLALKTELGDTLSMAKTMNNIGVVYKGLEEYEKSLEYYQRCYEIENSLGLEENAGGTLVNISIVYRHLDSLETAEEYGLEALRLAQKHEKVYDQCLAYNTLAAIYNDQNRFRDAINHALKANQLAIENGYSLLELRSYEYQYTANKNLGNYKEALLNYEKQIAIEKEALGEENQKATIQQESKYEYDKQRLADSLEFANQQEISDLKHEADLEKEAQQRYLLYFGLGFMVLIGGLVFRGYQRKKKDNLIIKEQKEEVEKAHEILEEKNQEILDSITYAKRIQQAILPSDKIIKDALPNAFVYYAPKDIVAGDFYWLEEKNGQVLFAAADCTGHGVPGAMVSVVCNNGLNRSVREFGLTEPGQILDKTRELVIKEFEKSEEEVKDGMDIALCSLKDNKLQYSGAHNPLWVIRNSTGELEEIKADKQPIGQFNAAKKFTTHEILLEKGDSIYVFSDGFADQFGGEKGKKFKSSNFKKLLVEIKGETMARQHELLRESFENWKGSLEQLDDVCIIGFRY